MIHPTCFETMTHKEFNDQVLSLTEKEALVYNALQKTVFATGLNFHDISMQTDIREAYDLIKDQITPKQFSGLCGQLAQKNLYRNIIHDNYEYPKKVVSYEGRRIEIRTDIAEIILADEVKN